MLKLRFSSFLLSFQQQRPGQQQQMQNMPGMQAGRGVPMGAGLQQGNIPAGGMPGNNMNMGMGMLSKTTIEPV